MLRRPRTLLSTGLAALALVAAACGGKDPGPYGNVEGETEATYLELGGLKYQVQLSRQLNPADVEDRAYLQGLSPQAARLGDDEVFFGVFLRVENDSERRHRASNEFAIADTQENVFRPVPLGPANDFRYVPRPVAPGGLIPEPDSAAGNGPVQGSLLLFRLDRTAIENRPLEFIIESPVAQNRAMVGLDV
jgi:hypothetical protein